MARLDSVLDLYLICLRPSPRISYVEGVLSGDRYKMMAKFYLSHGIRITLQHVVPDLGHGLSVRHHSDGLTSKHAVTQLFKHPTGMTKVISPRIGHRLNRKFDHICLLICVLEILLMFKTISIYYYYYA